MATANAVTGPSTAPCTLAGGSSRLDEVGQQRRETELRDETDRAAEHTRGGDENQELHEVEPQHLAMARAEALHQRDRVEPARDEAPRGHRDGHAAEQHADERGQDEEALGVRDGRTHFGAPVAKVLDVVLRPQQRRQLQAKPFERG